ncbi:NYN domain-containing protein [Nonomuraea sp. NPDC059023]|uniref:NYN domain-containing protein n=1 Tax=unclassified Nonomuraea TaxID=2593643 RepID=UPI0036BBF1F5
MQEAQLRGRIAGLIDAGFMTRSAAGALQKPVGEIKFEGEELVQWFRICAHRLDMSFLRAYWYDGAYNIDDPNSRVQRVRFAELEACAGLQLRLGHLEARPFDHKIALKRAVKEAGYSYEELRKHFHPERLYQQKGVDTLLVLDMMRLAQQKACDTFLLIAGDRDLAEAVRAVQQLGIKVFLACPAGAPVATELGNLVDMKIAWSQELLHQLTSTHEDRFGRAFKLPSSSHKVEILMDDSAEE